MVSNTKEIALESAIEKRLTGNSLEELKAHGVIVDTDATDRMEPMRSGNLFYNGFSNPNSLYG